MSDRIDPGHAGTRNRISLVSVVFLVVGFSVLAYGLLEFSSVFLRPSGEFFADPRRVMDEDRRSGFIGVLCIFLGATGMMAGAKAMFFARAGSVLRYAAAETAPVAVRTFDYVADETQKSVAKVAKAIGNRSGGEVIKVRCRSCGYLESEDAKFCSGCGHTV